ncbi:la-related protein 6-like [Procambarus clarkii]|uniref:la-related protein 6-like n=1 Tax=Procambarus clarkii TaxID=6728 RepID=UPI001E677103|nr:la-related protein 6-like [Procambarus clarkii]
MAPTTWTVVGREPVCARPAPGEVHRQESRTALVMSEADTEDSSEARQHEVYFTSSESDGPHFLIHSTSEEDEDEGASRATAVSVTTMESLASTDVGSDCTSEGGEPLPAVDVSSLAPELVAALVKQVETYFSDCSLAKDLFLLKHVKRQREGFVSLKLLAGYKRIKTISRDWRVLAAALRTSTVLHVNAEGTKVKRKVPLPLTLRKDVLTSRTIVAVNIPAPQASMASLATLFSTYGTVASLQVFRPKPDGGGVAPELQSLLSRVSEVASTTCAVVEYEDVWGAARAFHEVVDPPMTLHVLHRSRRSSAQVNRTLTTPTPTLTPKGRRKSDGGVCAEALRERLKVGPVKYQQRRIVESSASECDEGASGRKRWRHGSRPDNRQPLPHRTSQNLVGSSRSVPSSPASSRRKETVAPLSITRVPRGPDGTRGFSGFRPIAQSSH